jgi:hypothetical protein
MPQTPSIQQVRYGATQIAQQIAGARNSREIQHDLVQVNSETQKIQVQRTEHYEV